MLRNLKLWQKLGMLSLAFVIPTAVLVVLLRQEKNLAIDFARLFDEVSSATGADPTYLSVRYRF